MVEATRRETSGGEKSSRWLPAVFFILAVIRVDEKRSYSALSFLTAWSCAFFLGLFSNSRIAKILGWRE
jgi:hypothetical protein